MNARPMRTSASACPVCGKECDGRWTTSFSKAGTWCNHKGWVLKTGLGPQRLGDVLKLDQRHDPHDQVRQQQQRTPDHVLPGLR